VPEAIGLGALFVCQLLSARANALSLAGRLENFMHKITSDPDWK